MKAFLDSGYRAPGAGCRKNLHGFPVPLLVATLLICLGLIVGCTKPIAEGTSQTMDTVSRNFSASANQAYYAVRWALATRGYPVAYEDLPGGTITTSWVPTRAGSHYVSPFGSRDYGQTGAYHQLEIRVLPSGGTTAIDVTSRVKSVVVNLHSSGHEEARVLDEVGNYLRSNATITNLGVEGEQK